MKARTVSRSLRVPATPPASAERRCMWMPSMADFDEMKREKLSRTRLCSWLVLSDSSSLRPFMPASSRRRVVALWTWPR